MEEWYDEITDIDQIYQGDILTEFPIYTPRSNNETGKMIVSQKNIDCIVLSQGCDLENKKIPMVMVTELIDAEKFIKAKISQCKDKNKTSENKIKDSISDIIAMSKGTQPRYHLLHIKDNGSIKLPYLVVDFSKVHTVTFDSIFSHKIKKGMSIVLKTPYIEYTSQRFGNFYSRIGLPKGIKEQEVKEYFKEKIRPEYLEHVVESL